MNAIRHDEEAVTFQLSRQERDALLEVLQRYPVVPPAHHALSKDANDPRAAEHQRLLTESLAEQRAANRQHLQTWLAAPARFAKAKVGYQFTLERSDSEWLLQVLNDIRVGSWLRLGSPESSAFRPQAIDAALLPAWFAMEMSGYFQVHILEALRG